MIPTIKDSLREATEEDIHPDGEAGAEGAGVSCSASMEEVTATGPEAWNAKAWVCEGSATSVSLPGSLAECLA